MKEINVKECSSYQSIDLAFLDEGPLCCSEINQYAGLHLKYFLMLLSNALGQASNVQGPDRKQKYSCG